MTDAKLAYDDVNSMTDAGLIQDYYINNKDQQTHANDGIRVAIIGMAVHDELGLLSGAIDPATCSPNDAQDYCTMKIDDGGHEHIERFSENDYNNVHGTVKIDVMLQIDCYSENDTKDVHGSDKIRYISFSICAQLDDNDF